MDALFSRSRRRWANSLDEESLEAAGTIYWPKLLSPLAAASVNALHARVAQSLRVKRSGGGAERDGYGSSSKNFLFDIQLSE
jgi:hypothetical protein